MALTSQRGAAFQPHVLPLGEDGQQANVADLARAMGLNKFADWVTNTGLLEKIHDGGIIWESISNSDLCKKYWNR